MAWNVKMVCARMVAIVSKQFFKKYRESCKKKNTKNLFLLQIWEKVSTNKHKETEQVNFRELENLHTNTPW